MVAGGASKKQVPPLFSPLGAAANGRNDRAHVRHGDSGPIHLGRMDPSTPLRAGSFGFAQGRLARAPVPTRAVVRQTTPTPFLTANPIAPPLLSIT